MSMKAIHCGTIRTITNGIIKDGTILIKGGIIEAIGQNLDLPGCIEIIDASRFEVMPGMVDAHTHIGIMAEGCGDEGNDGNEMSDPVTPHVRAIDGIDPFESSIKETMEAGITTVLITPGSANCFGGQCSVLKTYGTTVEEMLLLQDAGMKMALGENPKRVYASMKKAPFTRMGIAAIIRENIFKAQQYARKLEDHQKKIEKGEESKFDRDFKMEALVKAATGKTRCRIHCHKSHDIRTAIRIADEFGLDITLEHCTEGIKIAESIIERNIPVVLSPLMNARGKTETRERDFENAAKLTKMGALVAVSTDGISQQARWLPLNAGLCIRFGMKEEDAFKCVTINAAKALGVENRVGSLEKGKDADLIITDGHPLETRTRMVMVMINGTPTYRRDDLLEG